MTTSPTALRRTGIIKPSLRKNRKSSDKPLLSRQLATGAERGTDGLTIAERAAYAQQAKSIHNVLPPEELEKAFNRLFQ